VVRFDQKRGFPSVPVWTQSDNEIAGVTEPSGGEGLSKT
jgi:hypothetical protein